MRNRTVASIAITVAIMVMLSAMPAVSAIWGVIASGGSDMSGGTYSLAGTVGQPVVGTMTAGNLTLESGFWYATDWNSWQSRTLNQGGTSEYQLLQSPYGSPATPYGLVQMDDGELALVGAWNNLGGGEVFFISFSKDRGDSWTPFQTVGDLWGRPTELAYLGGNELTFWAGMGEGVRCYSHDRGRTWPEADRVPNQKSTAGDILYPEGNPLLDRNPSGNVTAMAEIGYKGQSGSSWDYSIPTDDYIRWSTDQGRTWTNEVKPSAWRFNYSYGGSNYQRGTSEGSLVRAANGDIVAALRTDLHPRFYVGLPAPIGGGWTDGLEGTGFSRSSNNGQTWTPVSVLFEAGRQHATLQKMPNGWLVMTMVRRNNVNNGAATPVNYNRGCEALISKDNGVTWNVSNPYVLDEFYYYNPDNWVESQSGHGATCVLDDGRILTAYGKYQQGIGLIRWSPYVPEEIAELTGAKSFGDGKLVHATGKIATTDGSDFTGHFYIEEQNRSSGIRVVATTITGTLARGKTIEVTGKMATTAAGERYIDQATVVASGTPSLLGPLGMINKTMGGLNVGNPPLGQYGVPGGSGMNNIGLLVRAWGNVTSFGNGYVIIDDGSGVSLRVDTTAAPTTPTSGYVTVTGVSSLYGTAGSAERLLLAID